MGPPFHESEQWVSTNGKWVIDKYVNGCDQSNDETASGDMIIVEERVVHAQIIYGLSHFEMWWIVAQCRNLSMMD